MKEKNPHGSTCPLCFSTLRIIVYGVKAKQENQLMFKIFLVRAIFLEIYIKMSRKT